MSRIPGLNYVPSQMEAERMAALPGCRATLFKVFVGGSLTMEREEGVRCPGCGGIHLVADVFDSPEQVKAAIAKAQSDAYVQVRKGLANEFAVINPTPFTNEELAYFDRIDAGNGRTGHSFKMIVYNCGAKKG